MTTRPTTALILAAGMGERLRPLSDDQPKGLVAFAGVPLVARSVRVLAGFGIRRIVMVVGYKRDRYAAFASTNPSVDLVINDDFTTTGAWRSLVLGLERIDEPFLLLESDLLYEKRAIEQLLADPRPDLILASDPTGAGDEVWVETDGERLTGLDKDPARLSRIDAELVGIGKFTADTGGRLARLFHAGDNARLSHDASFPAASALHPIGVLKIPDLLWGELDDADHYRRLETIVAPGIVAREAGL